MRTRSFIGDLPKSSQSNNSRWLERIAGSGSRPALRSLCIEDVNISEFIDTRGTSKARAESIDEAPQAQMIFSADVAIKRVSYDQ